MKLKCLVLTGLFMSATFGGDCMLIRPDEENVASSVMKQQGRKHSSGLREIHLNNLSSLQQSSEEKEKELLGRFIGSTDQEKRFLASVKVLNAEVYFFQLEAKVCSDFKSLHERLDGLGIKADRLLLEASRQKSLRVFQGKLEALKGEIEMLQQYVETRVFQKRVQELFDSKEKFDMNKVVW